VALRVLRLVAVASIFALVLTARTVMPTRASTDDPAAGPSPADVDLSPTDLGGEPPPPEPPQPEPAPVEKEPPPAAAAEPAPADTPPADTPEAVVPPTDPSIAAEPPPEDPVEPAPTDPPPADTPEAVVPPTDPSIAAEPPPEDPVEPALADSAESDSTVSPLPDPVTTIADPADSDPSAAEPAPPVLSTHRSPEPVPPVAGDPAQTATARVSAIVTTLAKQMHVGPDVPAHNVAFHSAVAAGAGLAAGLVVTNQAPSSVAVAIEFGRAGGGWAGALVFNLWLRRQMRVRRMSQRQLAALAGVDHSTVSRLLRHDRRPSLMTATKLAGALRQVRGEQAEPETADYFERNPEETIFPARRVELALRADELLDEDEVRRLMNIYLDARRRHLAGTSPSAPTRARPARAAPDPRRR
jgi:transcriptional regulator with XRE-family HTH domain